MGPHTIKEVFAIQLMTFDEEMFPSKMNHGERCKIFKV